jgi:hypothetical protein
MVRVPSLNKSRRRYFVFCWEEEVVDRGTSFLGFVCLPVYCMSATVPLSGKFPSERSSAGQHGVTCCLPAKHSSIMLPSLYFESHRRCFVFCWEEEEEPCLGFVCLHAGGVLYVGDCTRPFGKVSIGTIIGRCHTCCLVSVTVRSLEHGYRRRHGVWNQEIRWNSNTRERKSLSIICFL